ncbi:hypothetical protein SNK03_012630 [Fusarium graminearum]|uniref:Chromosome 3, complete genome n=2 Tax=Gibberella zeae TaxID=5518 RepID=I1SAN5_GIBZE|nr:hypothetical protein FGSG_13916 [Fusarium graminearum PH-1]EYB34152.1 hypothetical protein FG05_13916 [Fusarium graminearum]ESU17969.1 hypothetical protein FGSG_13916 [Fusarium graminearum PH-1]CAF3482175.1 unnamed protein product [Fusarium graminearum]CAF3633642.1 unnamed protein product [Fusarium graminearum]CAG1973226.1 unnamed protein product [Fusarium graminearum]|eukprot:XP_011325591.1 hypothetical protein FGSG_13916 [Fusarium graminearum PH-1]
MFDELKTTLGKVTNVWNSLTLKWLMSEKPRKGVTDIEAGMDFKRVRQVPFLAGSWYKPREDPADRGLLVRRDIVTVNDELEWVGRPDSHSSGMTSSNLADTSSFDHGQIDVINRQLKM